MMSSNNPRSADGYGPPVVAAPDGTYDAIERTFKALLRDIRHSDADDAKKDELYSRAFEALNDNGSPDSQQRALAVVAMTLAMRVRATATGGGRDG